MVTAMFVFSAALVRTGAAEMIGGCLFRAAARNELLFQAAVFTLATTCSMFINETTIVLVFMPVILGVCKERNLSPSRYPPVRGLWGCSGRTMDADRYPQQRHRQ